MITAQYKCNIIISSPVLSAQPGQKQKLWRDQIKENRFLSPCEWKVSILKINTLFWSFRAIITTRDGWDGTNFYIGNRMVGSIKMSRNRLVNIMEGVRCTTFELLYAEIYILKESVRPVIRRSWLPFPPAAMKFLRVKTELDDLSLIHVKLSSYSSILSRIFIITRISRHYYIKIQFTQL